MTSNSFRVLALILLSMPTGTFADELARPRFSLFVDNDTFVGRDEWYTNGLGMSVTLPLRRIHAEIQMQLRHELYTPRDILRDPPSQRDLPYAARFALSLGARWWNGQTFLLVGGEVGWIGPSAGGEALQDAIHDIIDVRRPVGWRFQLPAQRAGGLSVAAGRFWQGRFFVPSLGARLEAGRFRSRATAWLGFALQTGVDPRSLVVLNDDGGATVFCHTWCIALYGAASGSAAFRDLLVEAQDDISLAPIVGSFSSGLVFGGANVALRFAIRIETRRFDTPTPLHPWLHGWGTIALAFYSR